MFGKSIQLFKIFGFKVKIDFSWVFIFLLVTWSLASGLFPEYYKDLAAWNYWVMGVAGAVGLFFSILFHELSHSLVARRFGLRMSGITLFVFGGIAEMEEEPPNAKAEFFMGIAGPLSSVLLGGILAGAWELSRLAGLQAGITGVLGYVSMMNFVLAVFNMFPGFPLDGGRVLRSALWHWKNDIRWATDIAAQVGSGFGLALMVLGVMSALGGNVVGGIWMILIGMFVRFAASSSYQQMAMQQSLEGHRVEQFMSNNPITVDPSTTVDELVSNYVYRYHHKMYPVTEDDTLIGCVSLPAIKEIPREEWAGHTVGELVEECSPETTVRPDTDAMDALRRMRRSRTSRIMVVDEEGLLKGVLSLSDLLGVLQLRMELGDIPSK